MTNEFSILQQNSEDQQTQKTNENGEENSQATEEVATETPNAIGQAIA